MVKNKSIFVDSNFFIALYNKQDALYNKAKLIANKIKESEIKIYTSNFIFLETVTVLSQRSGRKTALAAGKKLLMIDYYTLININEDLQYRSWLIFQAIKKKDTSFVDCSILAVMNYVGIKKLLTFDIEDFAGLRRIYSFSFFAK